MAERDLQIEAGGDDEIHRPPEFSLNGQVPDSSTIFPRNRYPIRVVDPNNTIEKAAKPPKFRNP